MSYTCMAHSLSMTTAFISWTHYEPILNYSINSLAKIKKYKNLLSKVNFNI